MNIQKNKKAGLLVAAAVASAFVASTAQATHFRGAALVPSIDANGLLTINAKSFWRQDANTSAGNFPHSGVSSGFTVNGSSSGINEVSITQDLSDSRRAEVNEVFTRQLTLGQAGVYTVSWGSTSWVSGPDNASGSFGTTSTIYWDGQNATSPIDFDLENVQQQVVSGVDYVDNLGATSADYNLTYDDTFLSDGMSAQARGYSIDANGQITVTAAGGIDTYPNSSSVGADQAFSGLISADDNPNGAGTSIEFVWLFDRVSALQNQAPRITDVVVNALVGDNISELLPVSDPDTVNGDVVTTSLLTFESGGNPVSGAVWNPNTLQFDWDSSGFGPGSYVATFQASDTAGLTDQGSITINLAQRPPGTTVSEPSSVVIAGLGLLGLAAVRRKRKAK